MLKSGVPVTNLSGAEDSRQTYFKITVPSGVA